MNSDLPGGGGKLLVRERCGQVLDLSPLAVRDWDLDSTSHAFEGWPASARLEAVRQLGAQLEDGDGASLQPDFGAGTFRAESCRHVGRFDAARGGANIANPLAGRVGGDDL